MVKYLYDTIIFSGTALILKVLLIILCYTLIFNGSAYSKQGEIDVHVLIDGSATVDKRSEIIDIILKNLQYYDENKLNYNLYGTLFGDSRITTKRLNDVKELALFTNDKGDSVTYTTTDMFAVLDYLEQLILVNDSVGKFNEIFIASDFIHEVKTNRPCSQIAGELSNTEYTLEKFRAALETPWNNNDTLKSQNKKVYDRIKNLSEIFKGYSIAKYGFQRYELFLIDINKYEGNGRNNSVNTEFDCRAVFKEFNYLFKAFGYFENSSSYNFEDLKGMKRIRRQNALLIKGPNDLNNLNLKDGHELIYGAGHYIVPNNVGTKNFDKFDAYDIEGILDCTEEVNQIFCESSIVNSTLNLKDLLKNSVKIVKPEMIRSPGIPLHVYELNFALKIHNSDLINFLSRARSKITEFGTHHLGVTVSTKNKGQNLRIGREI